MTNFKHYVAGTRALFSADLNQALDQMIEKIVVDERKRCAEIALAEREAFPETDYDRTVASVAERIAEKILDGLEIEP